MEEIIIEWEKLIPFTFVDKHENELLDEERGMYAIVTGKVNAEKNIDDRQLQYIGLAYKQTLRERILQGDTHPAYKKIDEYIEEHPDYKVYIRLGKIISKIQQNDSEKLYKDVEACLIYDNQPPANTLNKDSYNGRDMKINNKGVHVPLKDVSDSFHFEDKESYFEY